MGSLELPLPQPRFPLGTHHGSPVLSEPHSWPERRSSVTRASFIPRLPQPPPGCVHPPLRTPRWPIPQASVRVTSSLWQTPTRPSRFNPRLLWGASFLLPSLEDFSPLGSSAHLYITDLITLGSDNLVSCPMPNAPRPPHPVHPEHPAGMAKRPRVPHFCLRAGCPTLLRPSV